MFPDQIPRINYAKFSRCEERKQMKDAGEESDLIRKADMAIEEAVSQALSRDDVLRMTDFNEIDVSVKNGIVYLSGHVMSTASQSRVENAVLSVPDILEIKNNLVLDDGLTLEVAAALGKLEHTYSCKFFTGVSHGVVSINGVVDRQNTVWLAEKCAAGIPNVRGVINNVRVAGSALKSHNQLFLQPIIGETIYFLDGAFGIVKQVIINPNHRRVVAMTMQGKFTDQQYELNSLVDGKTPVPEQLITVSMTLVRYLTRVSGFLYIRSNERNRYVDFDPAAFFAANLSWIPPYPYCPEDVLIPIEYRNADLKLADESDPFPFGEILEDASIREQFFATDSFGL